MTNDDEAGILEQFVRNKLEIDRLTAENEYIKGYYKQDGIYAATGTEKRVVEDSKGRKFYVQMSRNARLNEAAVKAEFPPQNFPNLYKTVPDTAAIKKRLTTEAYERYQKEFAPKIEIGLV